ncbi:hypothetical protein CXG81DRAFT_25089 [Caulochytrium protostelioides]|uniref:Anaphase-promoting complex subunit 4 WD40 domain-containing protein n=1 Tax=Caulochytrium protostelioides TaxID=1555241 RepID=A0A4V1IUZ0_9FUNG|nr:hypothetical protein CXG81DRAFT_25089 [Caulochytrium protostelioides]|eukprot:RKP02229.1 hypothetical protein CXG81DRAFT_25089 [Caulochytrium protostelioides]
MQVRHYKAILHPAAGQAVTGDHAVVASAWSSQHQKLAVATADRIIQIYDDLGERKDKFSTKPLDSKTQTSYAITGLAWSPDGTRLAVAQSDHVVFVYKLGAQWGDKKSICNKLAQTSEVLCLVWPETQLNTIVFGLAEGKVRIGHLKSNKSATLYATDTAAVSIAARGGTVITGHLDGGLHQYLFATESGGGGDGVDGADPDGGGHGGGGRQAAAAYGVLAKHAAPPLHVSLGATALAVTGADGRIALYHVSTGAIEQTIDAGGLLEGPAARADAARRAVAVFNPDGTTLAIATPFGLAFAMRHNPANQLVVKGTGAGRARGGGSQRGGGAEPWVVETKPIPSLSAVTSLSWKTDGSRLLVGTAWGHASLLDVCLRRVRYRGKFELSYISNAIIIVKRLASGARIILKSHYGYDVVSVDIFQDRYLIAKTSQTLLMGDMATCRLSEVAWQSAGQEKYHFEFEDVCMVYNAGDLSLVEYGVNEIMVTLRTAYMNPRLLSMRTPEEGVRLLAYLAEAQQIQIMDCATQQPVAEIAHGSRIDWLELSMRGQCLLFRNKQQQLHLYDVATQTRHLLIDHCTYVQWVPGSDVIVAQSGTHLCVWYSIQTPERVTLFPLKGQIETIERSAGKTEVLVSEGINTVSYTLDEGLVEFGTALETGRYERAITMLESLEPSPETDAIWQRLLAESLKKGCLWCAQRCAAALSDMATLTALEGVMDWLEPRLPDYAPSINDPLKQVMAQLPSHDAALLRAQVAALQKQFGLAERLYLDQGETDAAMAMYQDLHDWDATLRVAQLRHHPQLAQMKQSYHQWLLDHGQEDVAAEQLQQQGDVEGALQLLLKGGFPVKASQLVQRYDLRQPALLERTAAALAHAGHADLAGHLYDRLGRRDDALQAFVQAKNYRVAIEMGTRMNLDAPRLTELRIRWAQSLVFEGQYDAAIAQYLACEQPVLALQTAVQHGLWTRALTLVDQIPQDQGKPYYRKLADHYASDGQLDLAERFYLADHRALEALELYLKHGHWERAWTLANRALDPQRARGIFLPKAEQHARAGDFAQAETIYLLMNEPDLAITMHKQARNFPAMLALVQQYHPTLVKDTLVFLGDMEANGGGNDVAAAERFYLEAGAWKSAVNMHCTRGDYEAAYRVAGKATPTPATPTASSTTAQPQATPAEVAALRDHAKSQVALIWAKSLPSAEAALGLLQRLEQLAAVRQLAVANHEFEFLNRLGRQAFDAATLRDIALQQGIYLEDQGQFEEAEAAFVRAEKPREAILMYIHNEDWASAHRVASAHDPGSVPDILIGQARVAFTGRHDAAAAEALLLKAKAPEVMMQLYEGAGMRAEAIRFATEYMPHHPLAASSADGAAAAGTAAGTTPAHRPSAGTGAASDGVQLEQRVSQLVRGGQYQPAIALLVQSTEVRHHQKALELAAKFAPDALPRVASTLGERYVADGHVARAAELYASVGQIGRAMELFFEANCADRAERLAQHHPKERARYVQLKAQSARQASDRRDVTVAALGQQGQWAQSLSLARTGDAQRHQAAVTGLIREMIASGQYAQALHHLTTPDGDLSRGTRSDSDGGPAAAIALGEDVLSALADLARAVLGVAPTAEHVSGLRDVLYAITQGGTQYASVLGEPLLVAHLLTSRYYCAKRAGLLPFAAKQAVSLLRYTRWLRPDVAFHDAGHLCREVRNTPMAFFCWNRYLDLADAIEDGERTSRATPEWADTDVPPTVALPARLAETAAAARESVRDWVLQVSLEASAPQDLGRRACEHCRTRIYEAALVCSGCRQTSPPCIVTGYPLLRHAVACTACKRRANRDDWNAYVLTEKGCSWCGAKQSPVYH